MPVGMWAVDELGGLAQVIGQDVGSLFGRGGSITLSQPGDVDDGHAVGARRW